MVMILENRAANVPDEDTMDTKEFLLVIASTAE
jgi:hypothetical protein